jgi:glutamate-1-semialdehyde 2,1-aminomutase
MTISEQLYERAVKVLPGGVSRNAVLRKPHPFYAAKGEGCYVTDVEGVRRIDFANNMASLIHGHSHPVVVDAVTTQLARGTAFTFATEAEILYAEHMCNRSASFQRVRFVNSGTEAVMGCLKVARAYTGRPKIAKVEGAYHGFYDFAEVSQTAQPGNWGPAAQPRSVPVAYGTPGSVLDDVVVIPFNDIDRAIAILDEFADEIACVLIDPLPHRVALVPADSEFLAALRKWVDAHDALLVFDEVITFRCHYGGFQEEYETRPDLTALGKVIGGGFPVGAIAGRADVMDVLNPLADKVLVPHSGTFSANPITMTAGLAAMELYDEEAVQWLNELGYRIRRNIQDVITIAGIPACVTAAGSIFRIHMNPEVPDNYRDAYVGPVEQKLIRALLDHLFDHGIMLINTCSGTLSTPMTMHEIDVLTDALLSGFRKIRELPGMQLLEAAGAAAVSA